MRKLPQLLIVSAAGFGLLIVALAASAPFMTP